MPRIPGKRQLKTTLACSQGDTIQGVVIGFIHQGEQQFNLPMEIDRIDHATATIYLNYSQMIINCITTMPEIFSAVHHGEVGHAIRDEI